MLVVIDEGAGFCFGVVKAIGQAEQLLAAGKGLYCLGDIVHNNEEVERLSRLGLRVIDHQTMTRLKGSTVLIRAHGEPPSTYAAAERCGIRLVDATCPIVLALQKRVRDGYNEMNKVNGQIVIFGKRGHAEVTGLNGQTDNTAVIVSSADEIDAVDVSRPIRLFSQTTQSKEEYRRICDNLQHKIVEKGVKDADFVAYNTICNRMADRASQLKNFAEGMDVIIFVSGEQSSNGNYLYEHCRRFHPATYKISSLDQLKKEWFDGAQHVGITGATSTPRWLMEKVKSHIQNL